MSCDPLQQPHSEVDLDSILKLSPEACLGCVLERYQIGQSGGFSRQQLPAGGQVGESNGSSDGSDEEICTTGAMNPCFPTLVLREELSAGEAWSHGHPQKL